MTEEFMTQFKTEGQPAFPVANEENENSAASSAGEETNIDQTGASDQDNKKTDDENGGENKDGNFADHPRWKEREDDWKGRFNEQEKRHTDEIAKLREEIDGKIKTATKPADSPIEVPAWFGGDEEQWKQFQEWNQTLVGKAKDDARAETLAEIENKSTAEQKAIDDATTYFNEQVSMIETSKEINPDGVKVDKNKLLKFVLDNDLVDSTGKWNYKAAFIMMKNQGTQAKSTATEEKKKIAGATLSENRSETKPGNFVTSEDFKKPGARPW